RSFEFADLASESVAGVQIYKTGRADVPSGGIGSTINITTVKPLDTPGLKSVVAFKALGDTSTDSGSSFTPELSGIYSNTFADDTFGVAISASVQQRDSGENNAFVDGWPYFNATDSGGWGNVPFDENQVNRPTSGVYGVPQAVGYQFREYERDRVNGQLTLQWQASDRVRTTVDYTYSENDVATQFSDYSAWYNFGTTASQWDSGSPVAAPLVYSEFASGADYALKIADYSDVSENNSIGFNVDWQVNDRLSLELDHHSSSAERQPGNSALGSFNQIAVSAFTRNETTTYFGGDYPVLQLGLSNDPVPEDFIVTGSVFENKFNRMEIDQTALRGAFDLNDTGRINFGVQLTEVNNRSASSVVQRNDWGGTTQAGQIADLLTVASGAGRFDQFGAEDPRRQVVFYEFDLQEMIDRTVQLGATNSTLGDCGHGLCASSIYDTDIRTTEDSSAVYITYSGDFSLGDMPLQVNAGMRYEDTDVFSAALVPVYSNITLEGDNEYPVNPALDENGDPVSDFTELDGSYDAFLPNLDFKLDITDDLVARLSYSETITRPGYRDIQGGITVDRLTRVNGQGNGQSGNPGLLPYESQNIDVSLEYYMNETDYISFGYFTKEVDNFIGEGVLQDQVLFPGLTHPATGVDAVFDVVIPINQDSTSVDGFEIAAQKTFNSGFGVIANATFVDADVAYDVSSLEEQFVLIGLSDSLNLIGFYETDKFQARIAYNWRDDFLNSTTQPGALSTSAPQFTEAYGQWDARVSYDVNDQLTVFFEGINLTEETATVYGRSAEIILDATQSGARYSLGARYAF
ncbi:MAG: TonB-dependent receptor, partial [Acidiferrobacterales bacterium]|nr:TonB-dependent receptor [Acidiferrobacterales bacterium]